MDNLSIVHFKAVWAEIQGRFFSANEANSLKSIIDHHTVTDPAIRAAAAKAWETGGENSAVQEGVDG